MTPAQETQDREREGPGAPRAVTRQDRQEHAPQHTRHTRHTRPLPRPRTPPSDETRARQSEAQREIWAHMPSDVREARIAMLRGLWNAPGRRERLAAAMHANWREYQATPLWRELYDAFVDARYGERGREE